MFCTIVKKWNNLFDFDKIKICILSGLIWLIFPCNPLIKNYPWIFHFVCKVNCATLECRHWLHVFTSPHLVWFSKNITSVLLVFTGSLLLKTQVLRYLSMSVEEQGFHRVQLGIWHFGLDDYSIIHIEMTKCSGVNAIKYIIDVN